MKGLMLFKLHSFAQDMKIRSISMQKSKKKKTHRYSTVLEWIHFEEEKVNKIPREKFANMMKIKCLSARSQRLVFEGVGYNQWC